MKTIDKETETLDKSLLWDGKTPPAEGHGEALVSSEIQEIISYRPHWIIRKGNILFLLIILFLLALTWFIKYPDIINGSARLVALNPPKLITSKVEGKLLKLFVTNEQQVQQGTHLGYMESTAVYKEVMKLQLWVDSIICSIEHDNYEILTRYPLPELTNLGELQTNYQSFQNELAETMQTLTSGYYVKKKISLEKDLNYLGNLKNNALQQQQLLKNDKQLQDTEYKAYQSLAKDKVIAPLELNQYKSKLIAKEQSLKQLDVQITNNDISSHGKQKEILELEKQVTGEQQKFHSALLVLKSDIEKWVQQYVLAAPEAGKVLFVSSLQENEMISAGQSLFYVQPQQSQFYAELMAGQKGLGKIKPGQKVMIKLESFPSEEVGYINGEVNYISDLPNRRDSFLIKVNLPKGLQTNYGKQIFFRNDLSARAEIITDNRKLFDRLLGQLKQVWER
ncbi:MAG: HlyD family efflux transporter periplasmic adaptor subunit [Bacteroidetes bacterium]|nr:HlyD family efflux transporter periplasmic adaptor subunit [Bacteroidota bacterium]MBS1631078.1 HlyD family efflux transporter periplasmic adaptor subunit [Bacteroidota bacterium]